VYCIVLILSLCVFSQCECVLILGVCTRTQMEPLCEDELCWLQLDDFRVLLIKNIEPSRITPYLRQCQVLLLFLSLSSFSSSSSFFSPPSLPLLFLSSSITFSLLFLASSPLPRFLLFLHHLLLLSVERYWWLFSDRWSVLRMRSSSSTTRPSWSGGGKLVRDPLSPNQIL